MFLVAALPTTQFEALNLSRRIIVLAIAGFVFKGTRERHFRWSTLTSPALLAEANSDP